MAETIDPVENSKVIGLLVIVNGAIRLLSDIPKLFDKATYLSILPGLFGVILGSLYLIAGTGLKKAKLWSVHLFLFLTGLGIIFMVVYFLQGLAVTFGLVFTNFVNIGLSCWFYSAKERFE